MNTYRYALAPTSQYYFCGIPFRLDTSPKCSLNCPYCFAMARGGRRTSTKLLADPVGLRKKFVRAFETGSENVDVVIEMLREKAPVHFGGMSDPFAGTSVTGRSMELFKILVEYNYPTVLSTKETNIFYQDGVLIHISKLENLIIQVSIPSYDTRFTRIIEPNLPSPSDRIKVITQMVKDGFYIIVRLQPMFPQMIANIVNDLIPRLGEAGVKHVIVEFLKIPVEKDSSLINQLYKSMKWDGKFDYMNRGAIRTGREWVLAPSYKWELLQPIINSIHSNGMTYGAGDYGLNHMSDTRCCCGIDRVPGFGNWFKSNFSNIIKESKSDHLFIDSLDQYAPPGKSIRMYMNSQCREDGASTLKDYLIVKWNRPGTENAPDTFLGITFKGDYDQKGNCVYTRVAI